MAREWPVRVLVAGVGLVVGLALGGLGPRAENRLLKARIEALEESGTGHRFTEGLTEILRGAQVPAPAPGAPQAPVDPAAAPAADGVPAPAPAPAADDGPAVVIEVGDDDDDDGAAFGGEGGTDAAREAMELRQRQAWRALEEQADPTPEQRQAIEAAVDAMNDELLVVADELARVAEGGQPPGRRDVMVFAADTLETMIATEDAIYDVLGDDVASQVDDEVLDPTAYIDASVLDVLSDVQPPER